MRQRQTVKYPIDFLRLHGWVVDRRPGESKYWNHPNDVGTSDPTTWSLREAVQIELINQQIALLRREGWDVEFAGLHGPKGRSYYSHIGKVRSALVDGRRRTLLIANAFKSYADGAIGPGWPKEPKLEGIPTLKAVLDGNELRIWCTYCGDWHRHGSAGAGVGQSSGHRVAHCHIDTPYQDTGYRLQVEWVSADTKQSALHP